MAKQIKAIKCPQCGSTQNSEIKPDYYRCSNCGTEYYLDNDDININYNYTYSTPAITPAKNTKKTLLVILGVGAIFLIIGLLVSLFSNNETSIITGNTNTAQSVVIMKYSVWHSATALFTTGNGQPAIALLTQRNYYSGADANGFYISFYDAQKDKEISSKLLQAVNKSTVTSEISGRTFSNGDVYFIINKSVIYKVDKNNLSISDVSASLFKSQPELQSGIATAEFVYENYGDGLTLLSNDGKSYTYYPLAGKLYNKDALYKAESGFGTLLPGAIEKGYYIFTQHGFDYPDEKLQLLKITYKDNNGGPQNILTAPSWKKDYGRSGIFTNSDPYQKVLISKTSMEYSRIISYKDMTPDRLYFEPKVLMYDNNDVLIISKASASPDAQLNLQNLDATTGVVKWTLPLADIKPEKAISFTNGFVIMDYSTVTVVNKNGTLVKQYKLN